MSWADYYFNFIHAKVLLKTRRKVTHNTQPLSQHCPTDRLHARFSLGIARYSAVNENHITRDFRQSHNMWSLFASRELLDLIDYCYHLQLKAGCHPNRCVPNFGSQLRNVSTCHVTARRESHLIHLFIPKKIDKTLAALSLSSNPTF